MTNRVTTEEARGLLGFMRKLLRAPELTAEMGCGIASGAAVAALALTMVSIYLAMNLGGSDAPAPSNAEPPAPQTSEAPATPAVENPTAVGQAVDAIAQPAIADVYGEAVLVSAPPREALIVSLSYDIPDNPAEGDVEKLRDAFIAHGATIDPENSEVDYHAGEEFMMLIDTGNFAFKTARVLINPDSKTIYVNADKSK